MVQQVKMGKERGFGRGLLLTIVTFGIYSIYWNYKAHNEVYRQYTLDQQGRDEGVIWLVLGLIVGPLLWVFQWKFVENVNYVRSRMNMPERISPLGFILWSTLGILILVGPFIAYYQLQTSINETWRYYDSRMAQLAVPGGPTAAPPPLL